MLWMIVALVAQTINGTAAVFDKFILKTSYPNPVRYTFWLAMTGLASLAFVPFGFYTPNNLTLFHALLSGVVFVIAMLFYFKGLARGHASNVVILMAATMPLTSLFFGNLFLNTVLENYQIFAFAFLVFGGLILFFTEQKDVRVSMICYVVSAAALMSLSNTLSKIVFDNTNFATGFVWIKIGGVLTAFGFLFFKQVRESIITISKEKVIHSRVPYLANRLLAGTGSALLQYAILLGVPALVDATASFQFVVVLIGSLFILKEHYKIKILISKLIAVAVISFGVVWLALGGFASALSFDVNRPLEWGVTFSQKFSESLGLSWRENYLAILDDLGVRKIRLIAYWDMMQGERGGVYFDDMDYQMNLAETYGAKVILAIGKKAPRWPECHIPKWAKSLSPDDLNASFREFLYEVVQRYKDHVTLEYWQIENEPFLHFGECGRVSAEDLDAEIEIVKNIDFNTPVLITDSGEISLWYSAAKRGDAFGTTMYRRVHNKILGYIDYHLPPAFFRLKESLVREFVREPLKEFMVIELGAEPWLEKSFVEVPLERQFQAFDLPFFEDTVRYAKETGFDKYYLWGAEWWYWLKTKKDNSVFWDYAKTLFVK